MTDNIPKIPSCFKWSTRLEEDDIILSYKGEFNSELVNSILALTYRDNNIRQTKDLIKNRLFSVIVESLQNVYKHGVQDEEKDVMGIFLVRKTDSSYCLYTGNFIDGGEVEDLKIKIEQVKKADSKELIQLQKNALKNNKLSKKSGAGIGLIEISKKSSHLEYQFNEVDNEKSFFSLEAEISTAV